MCTRHKKPQQFTPRSVMTGRFSAIVPAGILWNDWPSLRSNFPLHAIPFNPPSDSSSFLILQSISIEMKKKHTQQILPSFNSYAISALLFCCVQFFFINLSTSEWNGAIKMAVYHYIMYAICCCCKYFYYIFSLSVNDVVVISNCPGNIHTSHFSHVNNSNSSIWLLLLLTNADVWAVLFTFILLSCTSFGWNVACALEER